MNRCGTCLREQFMVLQIKEGYPPSQAVRYENHLNRAPKSCGVRKVKYLGHLLLCAEHNNLIITDSCERLQKDTGILKKNLENKKNNYMLLNFACFWHICVVACVEKCCEIDKNFMS